MKIYLVLLPLFLVLQESLSAANFPHFPPSSGPVLEKSLNGSNSDVANDDAISSPQNTGQLDLEAMLLEYIETDIKDFEDLKKTIAFLEKHISHHADMHVVNSEELIEADHMLQELDVKIIKPYEQQLESLKSQILKLNHKFDNETIDQITTIVENVEVFLSTSKERIEQVEVLEQEWEVAEETAGIQDMINDDEKPTKNIIIEALKPVVTEEAKKKLMDQRIGVNNAYPARNLGGAKVSIDKSSTETKSMYKKMKQMKMLKNDNQLESTPPRSSVPVGEVLNEEQEEVIELAKIAALKEIKVNLEKEALSDLKDRMLIDDPVDHYSKEVEEALAAAKGLSHEYMDHHLHHQDPLNNKKDDHMTTLHMVLLLLLALVVLIVGLVAFTMTRKSRPRVSMQNLTGVGGGAAAACDRSYMELEAVKEDSGWGRSWSPWSGYKQRQHKFK